MSKEVFRLKTFYEKKIKKTANCLSNKSFYQNLLTLETRLFTKKIESDAK